MNRVSSRYRMPHGLIFLALETIGGQCWWLVYTKSGDQLVKGAILVVKGSALFNNNATILIAIILSFPTSCSSPHSIYLPIICSHASVTTANNQEK